MQEHPPINNQYLHFHNNNNNLPMTGVPAPTGRPGSAESGGYAKQGPGMEADSSYLEPRSSMPKQPQSQAGNFGSHRPKEHDSGVDIDFTDNGTAGRQRASGQNPTPPAVHFHPQSGGPDWGGDLKSPSGKSRTGGGTDVSPGAMGGHDYEELPGLRLPAKPMADPNESQMSGASLPTRKGGAPNESQENLWPSGGSMASTNKGGPSVYRRRRNPLYDSMIRESAAEYSKPSSSSRGMTRCACFLLFLCLAIAMLALVLSILSLLGISLVEKPLEVGKTGAQTDNIGHTYAELLAQYELILNITKERNVSVAQLTERLEDQEQLVQQLTNHSKDQAMSLQSAGVELLRLRAEAASLENKTDRVSLNFDDKLQKIQELQNTQVETLQSALKSLNMSLEDKLAYQEIHFSEIKTLQQNLTSVHQQLATLQNQQTNLKLMVQNVSKQAGPMGAQGLPGPPGPQGAGNLSRCQHFVSKEQTRGTDSMETDLIPSTAMARDWVVMGVECMTTATHTQLDIPDESVKRFRCLCQGGNIDNTAPLRVCAIYYWVCPRRS